MTIIVVIMVRQQPYSLIFASQVKGHLKAIDRKHHSLIRDMIDEQLLFEPAVETTNRKRLREPLFDAEWELRFGPENCFRVFYSIDDENLTVLILAIGTKVRERLWIG